MILITPAQCRAARALLNWSQPELAERCDMHVQTISAFESENGSPTKTTLSKIIQVLEQAGIEFFQNAGVNLSENKFYTSNDYGEVLQDCLNTLSEGEEILFHCADDRRSLEHVVKLQDQIAQKRILMRATTCQDNDKRREYREYRLLPDEYFKTSQLTVIYADKIALHVDAKGQSHRFVTIKNKTMAEVMKRQFEYWWKNGKPVPQKK